jgi:hypothetical protein
VTAALSLCYSETVIWLVAVELRYAGREGEGPQLPGQISRLSSDAGRYFGEVPDMIQPPFAIGMNTPNSMLSPPLWDRCRRREAVSDATTN